jgi:hypothetical protein
MKFKNFLLNESKYYLGQKTGDLLAAVQSLRDDSPNMGNRALIRSAQNIINQIRRILHGRWGEEDLKYLEALQKIGVALAKAIDSKDDMGTVIASVAQELEELTGNLEVPINNLGSEEEPKDAEPDYSLGSELSA